MAEILIIILFSLLIVLVILQVVTIRKLRARNHLLQLQGEEINKQIKRLAEQHQELKNLHDEKMNIFGIVSHDMKSPLNRIFALTKLFSMDADNLTEEQKGYLAKMHQVIVDGLNLVRNLMDMRAIEDKGIEMMPEEINLNNFLIQELKHFKALADMKQISLKYQPVDEIKIISDKQYLGRIFDNLISNAIKFSPEGKSIHVKLEREDNEIQVSIHDEGPGFKPEEQEKLFRKYQKLSAKPTGGESSTGLGLSIVKNLTEKLGGTVSCESAEGKGAKFIVRLKQSIE